jgi:hypothetical protein
MTGSLLNLQWRFGRSAMRRRHPFLENAQWRIEGGDAVEAPVNDFKPYRLSLVQHLDNAVDGRQRIDLYESAHASIQAAMAHSEECDVALRAATPTLPEWAERVWETRRGYGYPREEEATA